MKNEFDTFKCGPAFWPNESMRVSDETNQVHERRSRGFSAASWPLRGADVRSLA
jgi:hypothetical protein